MNTYKPLYENAKNELEQLEIILKELEKKFEKAKNKYKSIDKDLYKQDKLLYELNQKKENIPYKNSMINICIGVIISIILGLGLVVTSTSLLFFIAKKLYQTIITFTVANTSIYLCLILIISYITSVKLSYKIGTKISEKLEYKSINKIINSKEYQELLEKINKLTNEVNLLKSQVQEKETTMNKVKEEYKTCKKDRDEKKILVEYLEKQINPPEITLSLNKKLKQENKFIVQK